MVKVMGPGSIIVDLAVEMGGNVEGSVVNERVTVDGVTIIGDANLPAQVPGDASRMFARNINAFLGELSAEGAITVNKENEVIVGTLVTHAGEICHQGSAEALTTKGASPADAAPTEAPETAPNDEGSTAKGAS